MRRANRSEKKAKEYRIANLYVNPERHVVTVDGSEVNLSYKEYMLLITLIEAGGNVVTRDALLSGIWGEYYDESRTLDVHIRTLRQKLGGDGRLIDTVRNVGYKVG